MQRPSFSIYDASAGSGKTYALVKEYLKIILSAKRNDAYRNILAITFTTKAVHEMKSRVVSNLAQFSKAEPSAKALGIMQDIGLETGLSLPQIKTKSEQIIKHIIHNYAAFDISTIDKFTHKVIRAFALDLGLSMSFEVSIETDNLLVEAGDSIIAQAGDDPMLTQLLIDFALEKTDDDKSWDISGELLKTGKLVLNENNRTEVLTYKNKSIEEFIQIKTKFKVRCRNLESENTLLAQNILDLLAQNGVDLKSFSGAYFPNHVQGIVAGKFTKTNKKYYEFDDIKINKAAKDKAVIENLIPELLRATKVIYANFEQRDFYDAFLKNITPLSLLNTVSNELSRIQEEKNVLSIAEFNAIIYKEIQNQPAPFIFERLGERYQHFFIDEFQDTSEMQWQNLIPLIDNATSSEINGEKGTLMIVGDPKQSIYRWRGGKAEQFIHLSNGNNPFNNPEMEIFHLDKNYRSYSQVIEFNNSFFQMMSQEFLNVDYKDLYQNHSHQKTNDKKGGYVHIELLPVVKKQESESEEEELDKNDLHVLATLNTIQKVLRQGFEYKDIAILTRKKKQGIAVANYLTEQQIPILSSETLMIKNATEVRLIVSVLSYLNNNSDLESKAQFLYYLGQNCQDKVAVHDFIAHGISLKNEEEFEKWLLEFDLQLVFKNIQKKSLYEAVEIIVSTILKGSLSNAYVQYFTDIVLERDLRNQSGISDFLSYWDINGDKFSIPSPEGRNAVRIMTVHASKGLEFPVVIMPFAEEEYRFSPKDKLWITTDEAVFGLPKVLIDNTKAVADFGEQAKATFDLKEQEELLDNVNVLYVALTRAEEQLYIISQNLEPKKDGTYSHNMAAYFIKYMEQLNLFEASKLNYEFGEPKKISPTLKHIDVSKNITTVVEQLDPKSIKIAQREAMMWGTTQQEAIAYGNLIHEILSYVTTADDVDFAIAKALDAGLINATQKEKVLQTIQGIISKEELLFYYTAGNLVYNEQTIILKEGKTLKPDRMVVNFNNEVYLLDYKTGKHQTKYQKQLEDYQNAIEKMGLKVVKKVLVYIGDEIEVVHL